MPSRSILDLLTAPARVMFIGAHPDDETTVGPLLALAADRGAEVTVVSLTRGDAGWNLADADTSRTLAEVRTEEFHNAAAVLGAEPVMFDYVNGLSRAHAEGLAVHEDETAALARWRSDGARQFAAEDHIEKWTRENGDPVAALADLLRRKRPTMIIVLDAERGYTTHPEHVAVTCAVRRAVDRVHAEGCDEPFQIVFAHHPGHAPADAERLTPHDVNARGDKDYLAIANESWRCYPSQYGPRGSSVLAEHMGPGRAAFALTSKGWLRGS